MKKFVVHTRALPGCCKTSDAPTIVEVDGEYVTGVEDPSIMWMAEGEFLFRILKPESLYESQDGSKGKDKVMVPPIYCSHSIFSTLHEAKLKAFAAIQHSFEFVKRKDKVDYTHEQVVAKCDEIQEIMLP